MTGQSGKDESNLSGGRAAERLREFIDQRFPNGLPTPDANPAPQQTGSGMVITEHDYHALVSIVENLGQHLDHLQQDLQQLLALLKAADSQAKDQ
ncbi:MAG: hypothetical protein GC179_06785 [Anaerolineaceae bacterium]|nr:hypothetical protein [Anaerolineaceae bacterium]